MTTKYPIHRPKLRLSITTVLSVLAFVVLCWCVSPYLTWITYPIHQLIQPLLKKAHMPTTNVTIRIGQQGADLANMYPNDLVVNDKNVHGEVVFYDFNWSVKGPYGNVTVDNGPYTFTIPTVTYIIGTAVPGDWPQEGIEGYDISILFGPSGTYSHQQAQNAFFALLNTIQTAGWKREIGAAHPRLAGRDALVYSQLVEGLYSNDATYVPTFEEWMQLKDGTRWKFYANGVYLSLLFRRDSTQMDPDKPGAYFVTMTLQSRNAFERQHFKPGSEERMNWTTLYPSIRQNRKSQRAAKEAQLVTEKKYRIDTTYRDPDE